MTHPGRRTRSRSLFLRLFHFSNRSSTKSARQPHSYHHLFSPHHTLSPRPTRPPRPRHLRLTPPSQSAFVRWMRTRQLLASVDSLPTLTQVGSTRASIRIVVSGLLDQGECRRAERSPGPLQLDTTDLLQQQCPRHPRGELDGTILSNSIILLTTHVSYQLTHTKEKREFPSQPHEPRSSVFPLDCSSRM